MRRQIVTVVRTPPPSGDKGSLVGVTGTMNAGKSALVVAHMLQLQAAYGLEEPRIQIFSFPVHDHILSGPVSVTATLVRTTEEMKMALRKETRLVVIDEAQLIDVGTSHWQTALTDFIVELTASGVHCVVGGLLKTFEDEPFGCMPAIAEMADETVEIIAECLSCHEKMATCNFRQGSPVGDAVERIAKELYTRVCPDCHARLAPECHK
ncbi:MAG: hypothetical protein Q8N16_00115 [bacterium]|nr:hypothetical protein [bacterium]